MLYEILIECLNEGKIDDLLEKYKLPSEVKQHYKSQVPEQNGTQLKWLLDNHMNGDVSTNKPIHETLLGFNRIKSSLDKNHINQYKTFDELKKVVDLYSNIVYHSPTMTVTKINNHAEAVKAAQLDKDNECHDFTSLKGKAQWCVSSENEKGRNDFEFYTDDNRHPLYTIKTPTRKFAFVADNTMKTHGSTGIFQDEHNQDVEPKGFIDKHPEIRKVPHIYEFIKHHDMSIKSNIHNISDDELSKLGYRASKFGDYQDIARIKSIIPHLKSNQLDILHNNMNYENSDPIFDEHKPHILELITKAKENK